MQFPLTTEEDPAVGKLRSALDAFYANFAGYTAFSSPSNHPEQWDLVLSEAARTRSGGGSLRILEIGAGRSGFPAFAEARSEAVQYTAQDVTPANVQHLRSVADAVHIGDVLEMEGQFEIVFSTFVLEHITNPRATLEKLWRLVAPGGALLIFCPCYDVPFYLPPSVRHHHWSQRICLACWVTWHRLCARAWGRPSFLITTDPAMFHQEWRPDRDAVHLVSAIDLEVFFFKRASISRFQRRGGSLLDWFGKNYLQVNLCVRKPLQVDARPV